MLIGRTQQRDIEAVVEMFTAVLFLHQRGSAGDPVHPALTPEQTTPEFDRGDGLPPEDWHKSDPFRLGGKYASWDPCFSEEPDVAINPDIKPGIAKLIRIQKEFGVDFYDNKFKYPRGQPNFTHSTQVAQRLS